MIITKNVEIKIMNKNIDYFINLGYNIKYGDIIKIPVDDLSKNSHVVIKVKCDICGSEKNKLYGDYYLNFSNGNFYTCIKCKGIKSKKTNLEKYGVEHSLQRIEIKEKVKQTMLEKYGSDCSAHSEEINEKKKKTMVEKYGKDYLFQIDDFITESKLIKKEKYGTYNNHNKIKETKLHKYNDENYNNRNKSKITNLEKYGFENVSQNNEIKKKKEETCFKNYGTNYPQQSDIVSEQTRNTNIERLGVPYPMMSTIIKEKMYKTNIENNNWTPFENRNAFYKYSLLVCRYTLQNKKELYNNWNGCDYYSGENILENFNLNCNNKNYPTIDHKISMKHGFDNNISPEIISSLNNLCVTTRSRNSSKGRKIETDFNI